MNLDEYKLMEKFEKSFWWHNGRFYLLKLLLEHFIQLPKKPKIFEMGCGTGAVTRFLKTYGNVTSVDVSDTAVEYCHSKGLEDVLKADITTMDTKDFAGKYDLVVSLDVLEHVQDDVTAMKKAYELLKSGGHFLVTVPAYKFLWSHHDEALHHKRRYHSLELRKKLEDVGFILEKKSHFVFTLFFMAVFYKVIWANFFGRTAYPKSSYVVLPKKINSLFTWFLKIEAHVLLKMNLPLGTTMVVVARK